MEWSIVPPLTPSHRALSEFDHCSFLILLRVTGWVGVGGSLQYQRQSVSVIVTGNLQHPLIQLIILLTRRLAIVEKSPCVRTQVRMGSRSETRSDPGLDPTQTRILIRTRSTRTLIRTRIRFLTRIRTRSATDLRSGLQSELVDPIWHFPPISCCLAIKYRRTR